METVDALKCLLQLFAGILLPLRLLGAEPAVNPRFTGAPFVRAWLPDEYGAAPASHVIVQHPRNGFIYVGNDAGVLEFDGAHWSLLQNHGHADAHALAIDGRNRIWMGSSAAISCYSPDAHGEWQRQLVQDRLPAEFRPLDLPYLGCAGPGGVFICGLHQLFFFSDDDATPPRVWPFSTGSVVANSLWKMGDDLWIGLSNGGVVTLRDGKIASVAGLHASAFAARALPEHAWHLLTSEGVERWDGTTQTAVSRPLGDDRAQSGTFLADGRIAFATLQSGVVVCDRDGNFLQRIDRAHGLPGNHVIGVTEDREGGLWVALSNGLARVQLDTPFARHGPPQGIEGTAQALVRHGGALFIGTSEGLFRRAESGRFISVQGVVPQIRRLLSHQGALYILGNRLHALPAGQLDQPVELLPIYVSNLQPLDTTPGHFVYSYHEGVRFARSDGRHWESLGFVATTPPATEAVFQSPPGVVWTFASGGPLRIDLRGGITAHPPHQLFGVAQGLSKAGVRMLQLGTSVLAITQGEPFGELFRYDEAATRFVPETRISGLPPRTVSPGETGSSSPIASIERVVVEDDGTAWLQMWEPAKRIFRAVPSGADRWQAEALPGPAIARVRTNALFPDHANHTLWIAGQEVLISRDLEWQPSHVSTAPAAVIRRIEDAAGQLLVAFPGVVPEAEGRPARFSSAQHSMRIAFAAPAFTTDYRGLSRTQYRTRLEGFEDHWGGWTTETWRDLTNLPYRNFTLRVQARDDLGRIGPEAAYAFSIAPPWWLTAWAWAGYVALAGAGVTGIVKLRTRALRRRGAQLEQTVAERTHELAESNATLAHQNTELDRLRQLELDEKLSAQLAEQKTRLEMLRYQLNPHFLFNSLNSIGAQTVRRPEVAREMMFSLGEFCRLALHRSDAGADATVGAEIEMLKSYLAIEQARRGDTMALTIDVAPEAAALTLPPFLLLPLVENAVKYGSRTSEERLEIRISACGEATALVLEVANSGQWVEALDVAPGYGGIGLKNLRERLERHYPGAHDFTTGAENGWVVARVVLRAPPANLAAPDSSQNPGVSSHPHRPADRAAAANG